MKLTFLGGADEVGASSTLLEAAGHRILVDCGVRMNESSPLPLINLLDGQPIDAIILTHAHADHLGALPLIAALHPNAPIFMTAATHRLATIMLQDAMKIMDIRASEGGPAPLYDLRAVEAFMSSVRCVAMNEPVDIIPVDIQATFTPAGHILGAACVLLDTPAGVALFTGDVSVDDQVTIPGMSALGGKPDIVIIESTYGGRQHKQRADEIKRLVASVRDVIQDGGRVLFPAFAIGRAQEVILILSRAIERGHLPAVPIYVDGLVRQICGLFSSHPELLTPWLRKRAAKHTNPFFFESGPAKAIWDPRDRDKILTSQPAIVVASSGMLTGGPSQLYARKLAKDPKGFIAITGYQDEESPGRRIQNTARKGGGRLLLGNEEVELRCKVGTYSLSAHADTAQLVGAVTPLAPPNVALVHGDAQARKALHDAMLQSLPKATVHLPAAGQTLHITPKHTRKRLTPARPTQTTTPPLTTQDLPKVAHELLNRDGHNGTYTAQDILWAWGDLGGDPHTPLHAAANALNGLGSPFKVDRKLRFLYRIRTDADGHLILRGQPSAALPPKVTHKEIEDMAALLDAHFAIDDTYCGRRFPQGQRRAILAFHFPEIATGEHLDTVQALAEETGWRLSIRPTPHQEALMLAARATIPAGWNIRANPSVHQDRKAVTVKLDPPSPTATFDAAPLQAGFLRRTGYQLEFKVIAPQPTKKKKPGPQPAQHITQPTPGIIGTHSANPTEFNTTHATIRQAFQDQPHQPLKLSKKNELIELAFITPQIGHRYISLLTQLSSQLGWPIRIKPNADQHRLKELAKSLIPPQYPIKGQPSFYPNKDVIGLKLTRPIPNHRQTSIQNRFYDLTGFKLLITNT